VLVNPANGPIAGVTLREVQEAAGTIGLQIYVLHATTIGGIDAAFDNVARQRPDALFVGGDAFFTSRHVQIASLAARHKIPSAYSLRDFVAAGGLMSYGTDLVDAYRPSANELWPLPKSVPAAFRFNGVVEIDQAVDRPPIQASTLPV
jgi:putative ABC transport system substrate-binding protein